MYYSVTATRTVVHGIIVHQPRFSVNQVFGLYNFVDIHVHKNYEPDKGSGIYISFSLRALRTSSGVGTIPPKRPKCSTRTFPLTANRTSSTIVRHSTRPIGFLSHDLHGER